MPFVLVAFEGMLDVACNGGIHVIVCAFLCGKSKLVCVVVAPAHAHRSTELDKFIDASNSKNVFKFAIGDECRVQ